MNNTITLVMTPMVKGSRICKERKISFESLEAALDSLEESVRESLSNDNVTDEEEEAAVMEARETRHFWDADYDYFVEN